MADDMKDMVAIRITPDGAIECLHNEELGLHELGRMEIRRASNVEYDSASGEWFAEDAETGERIGSHPLRSRCIEAEVRHFNQKIAAGYRPFGPRGGA